VHVVVLFNQPVLPRQHPEADSEQWVATAVEDISRLLAASGFRVSPLEVGRDLLASKRHLAACRPDVVFNLFEGHADRPESEIAIARLLERLEIPFTGSSSHTLRMSLSKHLAKRRLREAGLPTPWSRVVSKLPPERAAVPWPVIVKPARRDASEGIDQGSVATSRPALLLRVSQLLERYGPPVLIERFLPGREFTIALIETPQLIPLPISEVLFTTSSAVPWPILSYAAKWLPGSPDYEATDMLRAAPLSPELSRSMIDLAKRAYRAVGCRDYARIDLRMTLTGVPMILEVNANPDMSPTACFAKALEVASIDRAALLARFVRQAAARVAATRVARSRPPMIALPKR
jgi:D-alanine-D-alanine ligase